jgi:microfibrillar-associated protein 1
MSKLSYKDISKNKPAHSKELLGDETIFHEELRLRSKTNKTQSSIYRPGQAPAGFEEEDSDEHDGTDLLSRRKKQEQKLAGKLKTEVVRTALVTKKREPRKIHTATIVEDEAQESREPEVKIDVSALEIQGEESSSEEEEEDEDETTSRRAKARQRFKEGETRREKEQKEAEVAAQEAKADEDSGSSEYETDTEEEEEEYSHARVLLKPVFVSKKDRDTVEERKQKEEEELEAAEMLSKRAKERKQQSRQLVIDEVKRDEEREANGKVGASDLTGEEALPDDNDLVNEEEEIERWKIRELTRIKRDKELDAVEDHEAEETERRRAMTDQEIEQENKLNPVKRKEKGEMRFLQKYYHPGAFFQDDDEVKALIFLVTP